MTRIRNKESLETLTEADAGFPVVLSVTEDGDETRLELEVAEDLCWFPGHFPGQPVLAGVVQLHWAAVVCQALYGFADCPFEVKRLKFKRVVIPPRVVTLTVMPHGDCEAQFRFSSPGEQNSEGRIIFSRPG